MTWQTGLILLCLSPALLWALYEIKASAPMRRRRRKREAYARYLNLINADVKDMPWRPK